MKKVLKFFSLVIALLAISFVCVGCGEDPTPTPDGDGTVYIDKDVKDTTITNLLNGKKLYLTTFGQADYSYFKEVVGLGLDGKVEFVENNQLLASDVEEGSLVIAIVGFTKKGISGDITQAGEVKRASDFADKKDINLVIVQLDGKGRRGESSDPIISAAVKGAKVVMIYDKGTAGADYDGFYTKECKGTILCKFSDELDMVPYIAKITGVK